MRVFWGAVVSLAVACGTSTGNSSIGSSTDGGSPDTGTGGDAGTTTAQTFAVALGVTGNGEIDGLGEPCASTCLRQVQQGSVALQAVAASGFTFDHWSVACGGPICSVSVTSDMSVTATFVPQPAQLPPQPVSRTLSVTLRGQGRVVSTPAGIDCPGACSMAFADGTQVTLTETPGSGMLFTGFSGACAGTTCLVTLAADAAVAAAFAVDDCLGLMPAKLPPPLVPNLACNGGCNAGTSDDGAGNFLLRFTWDSFGSPGLAFVSLRNGSLQPNTSWIFSSTMKVPSFSEPSGFTMIEDFSPTFSNEVTVDRFGTFTNQQALSGNGETAVLAAPDPSGGFVVVRSLPEGAGFTETIWSRFNAAGLATSSPGVPIASERATTKVAAAAVTIAGSTLVETHVTSPSGAVSVERQWVGPDGTTLTGSFAFTDTALDHSYQFLLDGGLLERTGNAFTRVWKDAEMVPSALPSWLASRSFGLWLASIHEGSGYAMAGTCSGLEVLAKSGRSCGCMAVPGLSAQASIGRDGSLIVPRTDHFEIYPLLFHP